MLTERLAEAKREALGAQLEAYGLASHLLPAARQEAALPASLDTQARPPCISPYLDIPRFALLYLATSP